jgi:streptomycin 6-kinase
MDLPPIIIANITTAFGENGRRFLDELPKLLVEASRRWDLALGDPLLLSYNYVCAATRRDGTPAVLKVGVPNVELTSEINALKEYDGHGACVLYGSDPDAGMLLLERLVPGTMLAALQDDDRATEIAADLLVAIQRPRPGGTGFLSLRGWFDELRKLRPRFGGGTGPFSERSVATVEALLPDLFAEAEPDKLLHGDFHHFNILRSGRGWIVIDPKGVVGPPEYEVGPLLTNPWGEIPDMQAALDRTRRRIGILSERTGFNPQRMQAWALCHSLLSAWWDLTPTGTGAEYARAWIEVFMNFRV